MDDKELNMSSVQTITDRLNAALNELFENIDLPKEDMAKKIEISAETGDMLLEDFPEMGFVLHKDSFNRYHLSCAGLLSIISSILCGKNIILYTAKTNRGEFVSGASLI